MSAAAVLAAAFVARVRAEGLEPDPALRLLAGAHAAAGGPAALRDPYGLGPLHEQLVSGADRTRRGAWYTPRRLAEDLVRRAVRSPGTVVDPSCGGGVFLLAAADHLVAGGIPPAQAVRMLWGCDVDPLAVAVCEAALWWWTARHGCATVPDSSLVVGDALTDVPLPEGAAVVGNPPFLGQLRRDTSSSAARRVELRAEFGDVVRPYTDVAWLFLLRAVRSVGPGGRVALVQPQSLLGARDAAAVRAAVDDLADLVDVWVEDGPTFAGGVPVCAPVLERRDPRVVRGASSPWTAALADARGVPAVELSAGLRLGEVADGHAGFRDEYYGLVGAVTEGGDGSRLVTVGAIDPCVLLTDRDVRFAGARWQDPRVDVARLEGRARRWADVQAGPKLLVATQTKVLEAMADPTGDLLGSVPVLCVRPHDPERLWHLLAALAAPSASAWLLRRTAGTARSADACKPTVAVLADLPLPNEGPAWDRAADTARRCSEGTADLDELAAAADAAYGIDDDALRRWWSQRRPRR